MILSQTYDKRRTLTTQPYTWLVSKNIKVNYIYMPMQYTAITPVPEGVSVNMRGPEKCVP